LARSAGPLAFLTTPSILAQNDALRAASAFVLGFGAGGFKFELFLALYSARPLAVIPAPFSVGLYVFPLPVVLWGIGLSCFFVAMIIFSLLFWQSL